MKIAITCSGYNTIKGGIESHIHNKKNAFKHHNITYIKPTFPYTHRHSKTAWLISRILRIIPVEHIEMISYVIGTHLHPDKTQYDTVIFHHPYETLCKINAKKRILYIGGVSTRFPINTIPWFKPRIDQATVNSQYARKKLDNFLYSLKVPKVRIIPESIDTNHFTPKPHPKPKPVILSVGRITPSKGMTNLLLSMKGVKPDCKIILCGMIENHKYAEYIMKIAKLNQLDVDIISTSYKHMPEIYQKADIFILLSHRECFGTAVIEAQACGLPCIVANTGGLPELVNDKNGYVVNTPQETTNAINELLNNKQTYLKKAMGAYQNSKKYDFKHFKQAWQEVIK